MFNSVIANLENSQILSTESSVQINGELSVENGGLFHIQNIISTFGGTLSVVSWYSEPCEKHMAFMQCWLHIVDLGLAMRININLTPEQAANQIKAWGGNDIIKCKKCNMTLVDNSYFVEPYESSKYEYKKKSVVN